MMIYRILIVLVLINCSFLFAQVDDSLWSIKGKILWKNSHEPVELCTVTLKNTSLQITTDIHGNFEFKALSLPAYTVTYTTLDYVAPDTVIRKSDPVHSYIFYLNTDCYYSEKQALKDIEDKQPKLLVQGGEAPIFYPDDADFEKKYKVIYNFFGCIVPPEECVEEYNKTIFKYLDRMYGSSWRKEVRDDVFAF